MSANVGAVNLTSDGIGEVAIAPYYTTRSGWQTLINLTNTQPVPIVVKVRIHEGMNSRDVKDFNVALSANDVWTALLTEDPVSQRPAVQIIDTDTCVIGSPDTVKPLSELGFSGSGNEDGGPSGVGDLDAIDRMREGYIEFVVMGHSLPNDGIAAAFPDPPNAPTSIGEAIEAHDCAMVLNGFTTANVLTTAREFGEPVNALKFNFRLLNAGNGMEAGGQAITWANFFNHHQDPAVTPGPNAQLPDGGAKALGDPNLPAGTNATCAIDRGAERRGNTDWDPDDPAAGAGSSCRNLITAQVDFDFLDPSLNDAYPRIGGFWDDVSNDLYYTNDGILQGQSLITVNRTNTETEARGIDAMSMTIQRSSAINEWAVNSATGTDTSWVITFPTKTFYVDKGEGVQFGVWAGGDRHETIYSENDGVNPTYPLLGAFPYDTGVNPPYPPFAEAFLPYGVNPLAIPTPAAANGLSCNEVGFTLFDRAENSPLGGGDVFDSPSPSAPTTDLCYEVNVLDFTAGGAGDDVLDSELVTTVNLNPLLGVNPNATAGWMELDMLRDASAQTGLPAIPTLTIGRLVDDDDDPLTPPVPIGPPAAVEGLPTIGFMIKHRDLNSPANNYVSTIEHAYSRYMFETYTPWNTP